MSDETERVAVQTYVPAYQKELWADDASRMEVSQSEFVRMMVQAGRSEFELPSLGEVKERSPNANQPSATKSGDDAFRERVLKTLSPDEPQEWDELVDSLTEELEAELDRTLEELQQDNVVRYSGRQGGYVISENHDG
jgi:hypothetical protein